MQVASEPTSEQCIVLEDTDELEFVAGSATEAYAKIHKTVTGQLSSSPSPQEVQGYVLKGLLRQVPVLRLADIHELRVLLDVDGADDASVDEQIAAVFEAAVQIIVRWQQAQSEQRGFSA